MSLSFFLPLLALLIARYLPAAPAANQEDDERLLFLQRTNAILSLLGAGTGKHQLPREYLFPALTESLRALHDANP